MPKIKIAFAGTPQFALPSLENLAADSEIEIVKVFTQPDRPVGRGQKISAPPVKILAEKLKIPVEQNKLTAQNLPPDLDFLAVVAFGQILPSAVLEIPRFGSVNLHASLLPKFRGASPIQSAILTNAEKTGVSFQKITTELDAGDVFAEFEIPLGDLNALELSAKLSVLGGEKFPIVLRKIVAGEISPTPQNSAAAMHCKKIQKSDGRVDWQKDSAEILLRKKRAFAEWPGVWTTFRGQVLKLIEFKIPPSPPLRKGGSSGEIFADSGKIFVATLDGALELKFVQLAGKKVLPIQDFRRGNSEFVGSFLQ
ncbi:MAG: methionyl-tRNA formyltransferase [Patescibacteria group bacterium]